MQSQAEQLILLLAIFGFFLLKFWRPSWKASQTAFGTASWSTDSILRRAGMLGNRGLILGRTLSGHIIRLTNYCHILLIGSTGSGKGVSVFIVQLLTYAGSIICFDCKGDLFAITGKSRSKLGRVIRLAPFNGGKDALNPLDAIPADSPMLVDSARALAESLVVRTGTESDPHWNDKAVQVLTAILVFVLLRFEGKERSLNSVSAIASDERMLRAAAGKLQESGGIPARLGSQLRSLFVEGED